MRPPINSEKHIVQVPIFTVTETNIANTVLVNAEASPSASSDVRVGAVVKAVFVEIWIVASAMTIGSFTLSIEKLVGGKSPLNAGQSAALHSYANKKNIFYTTQGLIGDQNTNPVPLLRQWIKIPKGKQRFGLGDSLQMNLLANVENIDACGISIFKEYF